MKHLYLIAGKRKAGSSFLYNSCKAVWRPGTKDRTWSEVEKDSAKFLRAPEPLGLMAKADALLEPEALLGWKASLPGDLPVTVILVDRDRQQRLMSFIAHERKSRWSGVCRLRAAFLEEELSYQRGKKRLENAGVEVLTIRYSDLLDGSGDLLHELGFSPSERRFNAKTQKLPFFGVIAKFVESPVYIHVRDSAFMQAARSFYYANIAGTTRGNAFLRMVLMGSVKGPIDGQRRLTGAYFNGTGYRASLLEFNGHRSWFGVLQICAQSLYVAFRALLGRTDFVYIANSRTVFGMFRDLVLLVPFHLRGIPIVAHVHGADFDRFYYQEQRLQMVKDYYLSLFDNIVFIHEAYLPERCREGGSGLVVRNPIPDFAQEALKDGAWENRSMQRLTFGFISSFSPGKGIEHFLDVSDAWHEHADFVVAGGVNANFAEYGETVLEQLSARKHVEYLGYLDEPGHFYLRVHYLVFPTSYVSEAVPGVVIEALASGCVPIVLASGSLRDVFDGAPILWMTEASELPKVLESVIAYSDADFLRLGRRGRQWVQEAFPSEREWVERLDDVVFASACPEMEATALSGSGNTVS